MTSNYTLVRQQNVVKLKSWKMTENLTKCKKLKKNEGGFKTFKGLKHQWAYIFTRVKTMRVII